MSTFQDFNHAVIAEFRANAGKVGGQFAHAPLLLLTSTGARSGQARVSPLAYTRDGERLVIIASKAGAPTHPDWYHNICANPAVTVEVGSEQFHARAVAAEGHERERLYTQMAEQMPNFAEYQRYTTRQIPVVVLERAT